MKLFSTARGTLAASTALLIGVAAVALAQPAPAPMPENVMVTEMSATHVAHLTGANEVPANTATGTGTAWILFDAQNNTLSWTVEYTGLTGDATGAHFHGPADATATAGVIISLVTADVGALASPIQGTAQISPEQATQLTGGQWYVNIHTAANPGGEIRGQVEAVEAAAPAAPAGGAGAPPAATPPAATPPAAP
jgi:hypothetical protein